MFRDNIQDYLKANSFDLFAPKAILFDMDGVLYDSMPNHAESWHESMKPFGITMTKADAYRYEGMRGVETIKKMMWEQKGRKISDEEAQEMYDAKSRVFGLRPVAGVMPGVHSVHEQAKSAGLKIVVVTGSGQRSLLHKLTVDFAGFVSSELIVSSFDVNHGKPDPEPYLVGLAKAGVEPWEAIVVENAPLGVRAAVAAHIFTVAVNTGPLDNSLLANEGANLIFNDMPSFAAQCNSLFKKYPVLQ